MHRSGYDPYTLFSISRSIAPANSELVGPNPVLSDQRSPPQAKGKSPLAASPTSPSKTNLANLTTGPVPASRAALTPIPDKPPGSGDRLMHLIEGAFRALNATNPAATEACGLCLATSPPYYEGLAVLENFSNQTSPPKPVQQSWPTQAHSTSGRGTKTLYRKRSSQLHNAVQPDHSSRSRELLSSSP